MNDTEPQATVDSPGIQLIQMQEYLDLVQDIWGGTRAMRHAGVRHLPKELSETETHYLLRIKRSTFFNAYKRTVKNLVGKPFSKAVQVSDKLDKRLSDLLTDVDNQGRHLDVFAVDLMEWGIKDGLVCFVVDYPDTTAITNAAEENAVGPQPYWVMIDARNVLGCRYTVTNGEYQLQQLRLMEQVVIPDGQWGEKQIPQVRVLEPGVFTLYRKRKDISPNATYGEEEGEQFVQYLEPGKNSITDTIPVVAYYTNRQDFLLADPPLIDLAYLNVEHWQSSSDQRNILHVARVPILFGKGWQDVEIETGQKKTVVISADSLVTNTNPDSDLKYVEVSGKSIEAGASDLEDIENRMAVMGTQVLTKHAPRPAIKTATQTVADTEADYCDLAVMTRLLEDALENGIRLMGRYMNIDVPDERFVTVNKDFGISERDAADAQLLLAMRTAGEITQETFLKELQRRGILDAAIDVGDEILKLETEAPTSISLTRVPPIEIAQPGQQGNQNPKANVDEGKGDAGEGQASTQG